MPILHVQLGGEGHTPDGKKVPLPTNIALAQRGPVVQLTIGVAQAIAEQLLKEGKPVPQPISGLGLIDTGASATCIDEVSAQRLQLPVIDVVQIASASHASTEQNVYPLHIEIVGFPIGLDVPRAIGAPLAAQGLLVLIGRDALHQAVLIYNGMAGQFTLSL